MYSSQIYKNSKKKSKSFMETINSNREFNASKIQKSLNQKNNESNKNLLVISYTTTPKLFSLLDINDKKAIARGTSIPIQYERLSEEQIKNFSKTYRNGWSKKYKIKNINEEEKNNEKNNINYIKTESDNNINQSNSNGQINKTLNSERLKINKTENLNFNSYRISSNNLNNSDNKINKLKRKKRDIYLPQNYLNYENLVKNPKLLKEQILKDPFANKLPQIEIKDIIKKSNNTDIFFLKNPSEKEEKSIIKSANYPNNMDSDIFNLKQNQMILNRSGEKYLFKPKKNCYTVSNESKSSWEPITKIPTLYNYSSKEYNIIIPNVKNTSKTKKNIIDYCDSKRNINIVNDYNPIYLQKSLSEYENVTRVSAPNVNLNYMENYNKNKDVFYRKNELGACFNDSHNTYKNLCQRPFVNKL